MTETAKDTKTSVDLLIVDAFTDGEQGGNPAGVVLDGGPLSSAQRQQVASVVGLSETAFVLPSNEAAYRLDFFTPTAQIADCGHATVATYSVLRDERGLPPGESSKETVNGVRTIWLTDDSVYMAQRPPKRQAIDDRHSVASMLGLSASQLSTIKQPAFVQMEVGFIIVPVRDAAALAAIKPDFETIEQVSHELKAIGVYAFADETEVDGRHAATRMFAPAYGIAEEPATGMAAGTLAGYLWLEHDGAPPEKRLQIEQGRLMTRRRPSLIVAEYELQGGNLEQIRVGGTARLRERRVVAV